MRDTESRVRAMLDESGVTGDGSEELVERLVSLDRALTEAAPEPSPALRAAMGSFVSSVVAAPFQRRRTRMLLAGAVTVGTVAAGGIAAAANELPPVAQTFVAELSEYLPFTLPHPSDEPAPQKDPVQPAGPSPSDGPGGHEEPTATVTGTAPTQDAGTGGVVADEPTASSTSGSSPTPSMLPSASVEPPAPSAEPTGEPSPTDVPTDPATGGTSPAPSGSATPAPTDSPVAGGDPSGSASPSPTTNTRTDSGESPSASPSPSPSASTTPSPSGGVPSAGWTDE